MHCYGVFFFLSRLYAYARISLAPQTRVSLCDFSKRGDHIAIFVSIHLQFPTEGTLYYTYPRGRNGNMDWVGGITRPQSTLPHSIHAFSFSFLFFFFVLHDCIRWRLRQPGNTKYVLCVTAAHMNWISYVRMCVRACVRARTTAGIGK